MTCTFRAPDSVAFELTWSVEPNSSVSAPLLGWPLQWPSDSAIGHFELVKSSWLPTAAAKGQDADGNDRGAAVSTGVNAILVPVAEVTFVEFLES